MLDLKTRGTVRRMTRGFTLMELLVVIAIIAVLISFLLPALMQARRNSNTVKCLASLREIGSAFQIYAVEFQQAWPVVRHEVGTPSPPLLTGNERHWADLLAPYTGTGKGRQFNNFLDIDQIRHLSVIWGCPEWSRTYEFDPAVETHRFQTGYGMSPLADPRSYATGATLQTIFSTVAWVRSSGNQGVGSYVRTNVWGRKGADKLLVADSEVYYVWAAVTPNFATGVFPDMPAAIRFQPFDALTDAQQHLTFDISSRMFTVDGKRHLKPNATKPAAIAQKGVNALFADGHAATLSVREAYNATVRPGIGN